MSKEEAEATQLTGRVIFEILRLNGRLLSAGDALVADLGLSSARWQVLAAATFTEDPETVSGIAHVLGMARQSVQRVANELCEDGFIVFVDNPNHKRARLVDVTPSGHAALSIADSRRRGWTRGLATSICAIDAKTAETVLITLREALDSQATDSGQCTDIADNNV